jgi:hypothetical protein
MQPQQSMLADSCGMIGKSSLMGIEVKWALTPFRFYPSAVSLAFAQFLPFADCQTFLDNTSLLHDRDRLFLLHRSSVMGCRVPVANFGAGILG